MNHEEDLNHDELLKFFEVPGSPGVFVLGAFARRVVTVASQQTRALNLIWALKKRYGDLGNKNVCVVGGGFAGVMAAAASACLAARVTIVEKSTEILPFQRSSRTRYLHPYILSWPEPEFGKFETDFPFLNWNAGSADVVVSGILDEWKEFVRNFEIDVKTGHYAKEIKRNASKPGTFDLVIEPHESQRIRADSMICHEQQIVILATGFGLERTVGNLPRLSYWDPDILDRFPVSIDEARKKKRWLVSGLGDGGTIDCLRLRIRDFSHEKLVRMLGLDSDDPKMTKLRDELNRIENGDEPPHECYEKLTIPLSVSHKLKLSLRNDTHVTLVGKDADHPSTRRSCTLNRFCIFLLQKYDHDGFDYRKAELITASYDRNKVSGYKAVLKIDGERRPSFFSHFFRRFSERDMRAFDGIVVRHGAEPVIQNLLRTIDGGGSRFRRWAARFDRWLRKSNPPDVVDAIRNRWSQTAKSDPTMVPRWKKDDFSQGVGNLRSAESSSPVPAKSKQASNPTVLPYAALDELFFGRDQRLKEIEANSRVRRSKPNQRACLQVLTGLGGVGKTCLAVEYAWRHRNLYNATLFVRGNDEGTFENEIAEVAKRIPNLEITDQATTEAIVERFQKHLCDPANAGWLLLVDNVDREDVRDRIAPWLRKLNGGHVILTSRIRHWNNSFEPILVDTLARRDSIDFLIESTKFFRAGTSNDDKYANDLANELGDLCLALKQAVAYLQVHEIGFAEYHEKLKSRPLSVLSFVDSPIIEESERKASRSVAMTWLTSFEHLTAEEMHWLRCMSLCSSDPIPTVFADKLGAVRGYENWADHCAKLKRYSLLTKSGSGEGSTGSEFASIGEIHRLLRLVVRAHMSEVEYAESLTDVTKASNDAFQGDPGDPAFRRIVMPLYEHAIEITDQIKTAGFDRIDPEITGNLCHRLGVSLKNDDYFPRACAIMQFALEAKSKSAEPDRASIADLHNDLGELYRIGNLFEKAKLELKAAERIWESMNLSETQKAAHTFNCMGLLLDDQRNFEEAESYYQKALRIREALVHSDPENRMFRAEYATTSNDLGELKRELRDFANAKQAFEKSLSIREADLGPKHPLVAQTLNNLANLKIESGDPFGVKAILDRVDAIRIEIFRKDHQYHFYTHESYGRYFDLVGDVKSAIAHHRKAFGILCRFNHETRSVPGSSGTMKHPAYERQESALRASLAKSGAKSAEIERTIEQLIAESAK